MSSVPSGAPSQAQYSSLVDQITCMEVRHVSFREQAHSEKDAEPAMLESGADAQASKSRTRSLSNRHSLPLRLPTRRRHVAAARKK